MKLGSSVEQSIWQAWSRMGSLRKAETTTLGTRAAQDTWQPPDGSHRKMAIDENPGSFLAKNRLTQHEATGITEATLHLQVQLFLFRRVV